MKKTRRLAAGIDDLERRIDRVARRFLPELPLSAVYAALRRGTIAVNGRRVAPSYRLRAGDVLDVDEDILASAASAGHGARQMPRAPTAAPATAASAEAAWPHLVSESIEYLVFNKPAGLLTHGEDSLEAMVRARWPAGASLSFTPGPLHRLDRNTSGVVVFPKNLAAARRFTAALRAGRARKLYVAVVEGRLAERQTWTDRLSRDEERRITLEAAPRTQAAAAPPASTEPVAPRTAAPGPSRAEQAARLPRSAGDAQDDQAPHTGRPASLAVVPLARSGGLSLAAFELHTGLTHQIRAQAALRGHPLHGDRKYGGSPAQNEGYLLHALSYAVWDEEPARPFLQARAPLPPTARRLVRRLFGRAGLEAMERFGA